MQICAGFIKDNENHIENIKTNKDLALLELLDELDVRQHKVIIWCTFRHSIVKLSKMLRSLNPLTLTGDTKDVNSIVKQFQKDKNRNVLLAIQKKGSASITLTNCNYAIYYSNMWSYDERYNSEARIYRKGSEKHKHIIYTDLVVKNSIEEKILECLRKKKSLVEILKQQFIT